MMTDFTIKVPATSANLGPGFDLLGMALDLYNDFHFSFAEDSNYKISREDGSPLPFVIKDNLIKLAYKKYGDIYLPNKNLPPFNVRVNLNLPMRGGLGSSASAIIAGFLTAKKYHELEIKSIPLPSENSILTELAMLEGHPDNTTPALLGGFILSYFTKEGLIFFRKKFPSNIKLFLFIPEIETDTNDSRKKLPETYATEDIIFNMSRISTWSEFIHTGNYNLLKLCVEDKLHTPYRIENIPILKEISDILLDNNICYTLSGSGPTLLIYVEEQRAMNFNEEFHKLVKSNLEQNKINYKFIPIETCETGTIIKN